MKVLVGVVLLALVVVSYAAAPVPVMTGPAKCPKDYKRKDFCRAQVVVPAGKRAISKNAPWTREYMACLNTCAAKDQPVAKPRSFKPHFSTLFNQCKAANKCKHPSHNPRKKYTSITTLLESNAARSQLARKLSKALGENGLSNPIDTIENILVGVLRGVDLAAQVLAGNGKQIWDALACPACQCAVLKLYQTGCNKVAEAVCHGISDAACGAAFGACNAVICPLIDPLFASECMNIVNALQKFDPFTATVPFQVCNIIHLCKPTDENLGAGLD